MDDKTTAVRVEVKDKLAKAGRPLETIPPELQQIIDTGIASNAEYHTALDTNTIPVLAGEISVQQQQHQSKKRLVELARVLDVRTPEREQTIEK